jgi:FAD/FMN-containing dehydrogenase
LSNAVAQLADALGHERLLPARAVARRVTSYWNSAPMQAQAMVLPHSTAEVATALRCCHGAGQSVITHGGLTGCVAGAESTRDDVVLSLEKLRGIEDIDLAGGTATVAAGTVLQTLQETVAEAGLYFPLDLGARGSCTIGGNVATNAGGINVLRYGMMRNLVLGLEAVLADGTIVSSMNRMLKNNAGYDLKQLFIGSEGTLGVVTRVVLRLFPQPASRQNALVAAPSFEAVTRLAQTLHLRADVGRLCRGGDGPWRSPRTAGNPPPVLRGTPSGGRRPERGPATFRSGARASHGRGAHRGCSDPEIRQ